MTPSLLLLSTKRLTESRRSSHRSNLAGSLRISINAVRRFRIAKWSRTIIPSPSPPLDGARRLARDVVRHAVDPAHLVDDAVCDGAHQGAVELALADGPPAVRMEGPGRP